MRLVTLCNVFTIACSCLFCHHVYEKIVLALLGEKYAELRFKHISRVVTVTGSQMLGDLLIQQREEKRPWQRNLQHRLQDRQSIYNRI